MSGGDFDIANVTLVSPAHGSSRPFPITFTWQRRGLAGDTYRWMLFDPANPAVWWLTSDLGDTGSITVTGLPPGAKHGYVYGWRVRVYRGSDSYGTPFYAHQITFVSTTGQSTGTQLPDDPIWERGDGR